MIEAPSSKGTRIADWIERTALLQGTSPISQLTLREAGAEVGFGEADIAVGMSIVLRRAAQLRDAYPFRVGAGVAAREGASAFPWTTLLLMSSESPARSHFDIATAAAHFERVTTSAVARMYGPETQAVRFAWPSDDGRPQEFRAAIEWLASRMGVQPGDAYRPPYAKDGGVDVVVWRPFPDRRSGFPVMLIQCTLERNYTHKARDIDLPIWAGYLRLDIPPTTALAIPDVVPAGEEWNALAARAVILDRTRIVALAGAQGGLAREIEDWTATAIENLQEP